MTAPLPPLLLVDDEKNMRHSLEVVMANEGYTLRSAESAEEGLRLLENETFFMVVVDARLGGMSGYELLGEVQKRWSDLPVIMITAYATPKLAVEAIKAGAIDYLPKPFAPEELLHATARCAERYRLIQENEALKAESEDQGGLERIVGESAKMKELTELVQTVAPTNATVLILGESGTGKELIASALHYLSDRSDAPYIRINCAAIPEALLESELFGHEKGSFTGAMKQKRGRVEEANGGTIFLDEIGDMSRPLQAKLLRFLEDGSFMRIGGNQELQVDVRLIAATNRDIVQAIQQDLFREDLFHRLNVVQFRMPPLRERGQDIIRLAEHFLEHFCHGMNKGNMTLSQEAKQRLLSHPWPGNVRELRNAVERAVILEKGKSIKPESLPDFQVEARLKKADDSAHPPTLPEGASLEETLNKFERELIVSTLERFHYNLTKTAEQLQISRHALRYRMQRLEINNEDSEEEVSVPGSREKAS